MAANKLKARIAELEAQVTDLKAKNQELSSAKKQAEETHEKEKEQSKVTYEQNLKSVQNDLGSQIKAKENKVEERHCPAKRRRHQAYLNPAAIQPSEGKGAHCLPALQ